jgi:hypothetical protein
LFGLACGTRILRVIHWRDAGHFQTEPVPKAFTIHDSQFTIHGMFCPSCGSENTIGLPYCNRCGANLSALATQPQTVQVNLTKPTVIIAFLLAVFTLGGFGALIGGALSLAPVLHGNDPLMAVIFFGMIIILTVDIFLVRQLSKLIGASLSSTPVPQQPQRNVANRGSAQLQQPVDARLRAAPSVTENTTRFFEPACRTAPETDELASVQNTKN